MQRIHKLIFFRMEGQMHFESANKDAAKAISKVKFGGASRRQKEQQSSIALAEASTVEQRKEVGKMVSFSLFHLEIQRFSSTFARFKR